MRRALTVSTVLVVLVSFVAPDGDACTTQAATLHGCCAAPVSETTPAATSCCGEASLDHAARAVDMPRHVSRSSSCDCVHAPGVPEVVTAAAPAPCDDGLATAPSTGRTPPTAEPTRSTQNLWNGPLTTAESPPLYLTACAFLI